MAFVRRKGNSYFLVHNVRRDGKVKQIHLAKLENAPALPRMSSSAFRAVTPL